MPGGGGDGTRSLVAEGCEGKELTLRITIGIEACYELRRQGDGANQIDQDEPPFLRDQCHELKDRDGEHVEDHQDISKSTSFLTVAKVKRIESVGRSPDTWASALRAVHRHDELHRAIRCGRGRNNAPTGLQVSPTQGAVDAV